MANSEKTRGGGKGGDIVVFMIRRDTQCSDCGDELGKGRLLRVEGDKALCLACADLDHLEFLPRGDTALTRRASKYSRLRAVVVEWSRTRKQYERQGILAEPQAIEHAEAETLADADYRERQRERAAERREGLDREYVAAIAAAIREQFPACPAGEETRIAEHACLKHSGRVGRSAAARTFAAEAVHLAVLAHIRHTRTNYDELLCEHGDRQLARAEVQEQVLATLRLWQGGTESV
jgi:hypothetical protein